MNIAMRGVAPSKVRSFTNGPFEMTAFQPTPAPHTLLAAAAAIITASNLPLGDDLDATVEIVAKALGKLDADEVDNFIMQDCSPATATEIVYAALELEASPDEGATVAASASTSNSLPAIEATATGPSTTPIAAMLTMIKEIVLPVAEVMAAQEIKLVEITSRLARLEERDAPAWMGPLTSLGTDMMIALRH